MMPAARRNELPLAGLNGGEQFEERRIEWGDMDVAHTQFPPGNLAPFLKGLPDDRCQCPHWGFVFKGRIVVRYADHEETIEAGQSFYMAPGHVPEAVEECEIVQFSPAEAMRVTDAAMARNLAALRAGAH